MESLRTTSEHWIKKAEVFFKTDIRYLLKGGSWLGGNQAVTSLLAFLLSLAFANLVSPTTYGLYKYALSLATILAIPTLSGIDIAATQAVARKLEGTVLEGMKTKLIWGIGTTVIGIILGGYYILHGNPLIGWSVILIGIGTPLSEAFDIYNSLLNGRGNYASYTRYNLLTQFIFSIGMVAAILSHANVVALVAAYVLLNVLLNIFFLLRTLYVHRPNKDIDPKAMNFGKHMSAVDVIGTILGQLDKVLIFHFLGPVDLVVYTLALAPSEQIKGALKNIQFLALPKFASRSKEEGKQGLFRKAFYFGLLITATMFVYVLIVPYFFKIFFPKYLASIIYAQIVSVSVIAASVGMFLYVFLESHAAKKQIYQYNIISNVVNVVVLFPFIYYWGIMGAILALIVTRFTLLVTSVVLVKNV